MISTNTTCQVDLSIITVNYNGFGDTCQMIVSLLNTCLSISYQIIVVDNGSLSDQAAQIKELYPQVTAIRSEVNLGFAGGNNIGIKAAKGRYIMLLNNDTIVEDDSLHYLIERLESSVNIGAVSPKIVFESRPRNIQFAGYTPLSSITLRNSLIGFNSPDTGQYDTAHPTPYAHGAAMMVKREAIEAAGLMPEIFFLYYEELDWSTRISQSGFELWYEPRCTIFHKESRSTGADSPLRTFYLARNRMLYAWRNLKWWQVVASMAYQLGIALPKGVLVNILRNKPALAWATIRSAGAFFAINNKKG